MMRQPISLGRPYGLFSRFRPWLLPGTLLLVGLAIALAGGITSTNLKSGTIFLVVVFAVLLVLWIAVQPTIGVYLLTAFVFLNLSDILEVQFGIVSINKIVVGLVFVSILANRLLHHR